MFSLILISSIIMMISFIVMILASILSKKNYYWPSKKFSIWMWVWSKIFFTITFYFTIFLITIIFLIFDVEIALMLPMIIILKFSNLMAGTLPSIIFILILLIGLYHECNQGMLNWSV